MSFPEKTPKTND